MTQDDRMETITDPAAIRASDEPDERGDFPRCTTPAPVSGAGLDLDAIEAMVRRGALYDCDALTLALVAEVRRLTESRSTVAANLAASLLRAEAEVRTLQARSQHEHERWKVAHGKVDRKRRYWKSRAEAAEADVVTLRARLAAVEALADQWADRKRSDGMSGNAWIGLTLSGVAADLRAALATTGEGQ